MMSLWLLGQLSVIRFIDLHSWLWHFEPITNLTKSGEAHDISVWTYTCFFVENQISCQMTISSNQEANKRKNNLIQDGFHCQGFYQKWRRVPKPNTSHSSKPPAAVLVVDCLRVSRIWLSTLNLLPALNFQFELGYQNNKGWESDQHDMKKYLAKMWREE